MGAPGINLSTTTSCSGWTIKIFLTVIIIIVTVGDDAGDGGEDDASYHGDSGDDYGSAGDDTHFPPFCSPIGANADTMLVHYDSTQSQCHING